jgi:hypothetical protein
MIGGCQSNIFKLLEEMRICFAARVLFNTKYKLKSSVFREVKAGYIESPLFSGGFCFMSYGLFKPQSTISKAY